VQTIAKKTTTTKQTQTNRAPSARHSRTIRVRVRCCLTKLGFSSFFPPFLFF
jgi:hypothetical protein